MTTRVSTVAVEKVGVSAYRIPTDLPESDGTYAWDSTTLVLVEAVAGGRIGVGYTYADTATAVLVKDLLAKTVSGRDAMDVPGCWQAMVQTIRNLGRPGIASMAIAAVDVALWDLKAKLLDVALVTLLGATRETVPIYGSGGFTSYSIQELQEQLGGWVREGIPRVKMKIGTHPADDLARVCAARAAIGPDAALYVDANGAYSRKQALDQAQRFREEGVVWFEEPVPSADLAGLHLLRDSSPAGMEIAAGEYGYDLPYFRRMLEAEAVDVLQADATRCAGITGFLRAAALTEARLLQLSAHCAPSLHVAACCAIDKLSPIEYFHDHVRIEHMLFDGALTPVAGALRPDRGRPGLGLEFKQADAARFAL
ncbi:MAG TPA: enolase C-terminal domain-like protein [Chloroflexota bacterium]|nr:enolase C-terminal domain-like protein [Chloroflexota bacterium]